MADITMSLDETLEVDAVVEEWNSPSDVITDSDDQFDVSGIQTNTGVLNPKNTGEHKITVNGQELTVKVTDPTTIPDSVVTWTTTNTSSNNPEQQGVYFNSTEDWPEFSATLGDNTGNVTQAYVYERVDTSNVIATKDISGVGGGGSFTIDVSLSAGVDYVLVADDNGNDYGYDFGIESSAPKTSSDGALTLEDGYKVGGGNTGTSIPHVFKAIGNV